MDKRYLYFLSNESMSGIFMISTTERTPDIELNEANSVDKLNLPTLYKLEFAIKISNPEEKSKNYL